MSLDGGNNLIGLIRLYISEVERCISLLKNEFNSNNIINDRKVGKIPFRGKILKNIEFEFHGVGCRFNLPNEKSVDFDFGYKGRFDGFSLGWLKNFLEENCQNEFPYYSDFSLLKKDFEKLEKDGVIVRSYFPHDSLYYLSQN